MGNGNQAEMKEESTTPWACRLDFLWRWHVCVVCPEYVTWGNLYCVSLVFPPPPFPPPTILSVAAFTVSCLHLYIYIFPPHVVLYISKFNLQTSRNLAVESSALETCSEPPFCYISNRKMATQRHVFLSSNRWWWYNEFYVMPLLLLFYDHADISSLPFISWRRLHFPHLLFNLPFLHRQQHANLSYFDYFSTFTLQHCDWSLTLIEVPWRSSRLFFLPPFPYYQFKFVEDEGHQLAPL